MREVSFFKSKCFFFFSVFVCGGGGCNHRGEAPAELKRINPGRLTSSCSHRNSVGRESKLHK